MLDVAAQLGCGVVTSMAGRSAAPQDHANHLYGYGAGADEARGEADVILALGTRLGNLDTPYNKYWGDEASQKLIQIDMDPRNLGVTRRLALGIVSDLGSALGGLSQALAEAPTRRQRRGGPGALSRDREGLA